MLTFSNCIFSIKNFQFDFFFLRHAFFKKFLIILLLITLKTLKLGPLEVEVDPQKQSKTLLLPTFSFLIISKITLQICNLF